MDVRNVVISGESKVVVIDEDADANYGRKLILNFLNTYDKIGSKKSFKYLLCSDTKHQILKTFKDVENFEIYDFFSTTEDSEQVDIFNKVKTLILNEKNSVFVIDCLCSLALEIGVSKTCKLVKEFLDNNVQVFCIYRRDFDPVGIPMIETLGNIYIKIYKLRNTSFISNNIIIYKIFVIRKKPGGNVEKWHEKLQQNIETTEIRSEIIKDSSEKQKNVSSMEQQAMPESSFRLEINEEEMKQKESVVLPYTSAADPNRESKIDYIADDMDDLDEEDPDDDLFI